jgi:hypothetical protein
VGAHLGHYGISDHTGIKPGAHPVSKYIIMEHRCSITNINGHWAGYYNTSPNQDTVQLSLFTSSDYNLGYP